MDKEDLVLREKPTSHHAARDWQSGGEALFWPHVGPMLFLALIFFINFTSRIILAPLLPTIERDLGITHSQAGSFFLLISVGYFTALLGSGFVSARLTHRGTILFSCAFVGIILLSISLLNSLWGIRLGLLLLGMGGGIYMPSAFAAITSLVGPRHWGKAIAIHELAPNLAFIAAPVLAEIFLGWSTWRAALAFLGGAALIISVAFARYGKGGEFPGEIPAAAAFRTLAGKRSFWILVFLFGLGIAATIGVFSMLTLFLVTEREMDRNWANTLVALSRIPAPVTAFAAGWASDRLSPRLTIAGSLLLTGITTLLFGIATGGWLVVSVILQPSLAVCFFPAGFAALAAIGPASSRNVAVSFTVPFGFLLGGGAIPMFIGIMGDSGSFALGFTLVGGLILTGVALSLYLKVPKEA